MVLTHPKLDFNSIIKLLGTEFIISQTFQWEHYFTFACPGNFHKEDFRKDDFAGKVPYVYMYLFHRLISNYTFYQYQCSPCMDEFIILVLNWINDMPIPAVLVH